MRVKAGRLIPSEAELQRAVLELAAFTGWTVAHFRTSRTSQGRHLTAVAADGAGFPDLVLVRDRVLFRELKAENGRLSPRQVMWAEALRRAGADWDVWRPSDWSRIEAELSARVTIRGATP